MIEGDDQLGSILKRVSLLRFKITDAIQGSGEGVEIECSRDEGLFGIRETLESLEMHLTCLQALYQRQLYERAAALKLIDQSRRTLLVKLEEYNGEDIEAIHETSTFASEYFEQKNGFFSLLPSPFHHSTNLVVVNENNSSSHIDSINSSYNNGLTVDSTHENRKENLVDPTAQKTSQNQLKGMKFVLRLISKSAICVFGIVFVLNIAGFRLEIKKRGSSISLMELLLPGKAGEKKVMIQCPANKALVIEDGKPRCLVKERIEIPVGSNIEYSGINIAFG